MNCKECGRKPSSSNLIYSIGICLEELRRATKVISHDGRCADRDLNRKLPNTIKTIRISWLDEQLLVSQK
jgi:hypothetical protein